MSNWLTISQSSGTPGNVPITIRADESNTKANRTATIVFKSANGGVSRRIVVTQKGNPNIIDNSFSAPKISLSASGLVVTLKVTLPAMNPEGVDYYYAFGKRSSDFDYSTGPSFFTKITQSLDTTRNIAANQLGTYYLTAVAVIGDKIKQSSTHVEVSNSSMSTPYGIIVSTPTGNTDSPCLSRNVKWEYDAVGNASSFYIYYTTDTTISTPKNGSTLVEGVSQFRSSDADGSFSFNPGVTNFNENITGLTDETKYKVWVQAKGNEQTTDSGYGSGTGTTDGLPRFRVETTATELSYGQEARIRFIARNGVEGNSYNFFMSNVGTEYYSLTQNGETVTADGNGKLSKTVIYNGTLSTEYVLKSKNPDPTSMNIDFNAAVYNSGELISQTQDKGDGVTIRLLKNESGIGNTGRMWFTYGNQTYNGSELVINIPASGADYNTSTPANKQIILNYENVRNINPDQTPNTNWVSLNTSDFTSSTSITLDIAIARNTSGADRECVITFDSHSLDSSPAATLSLTFRQSRESVVFSVSPTALTFGLDITRWNLTEDVTIRSPHNSWKCEIVGGNNTLFGVNEKLNNSQVYEERSLGENQTMNGDVTTIQLVHKPPTTNFVDETVLTGKVYSGTETPKTLDIHRYPMLFKNNKPLPMVLIGYGNLETDNEHLSGYDHFEMTFNYDGGQGGTQLSVTSNTKYQLCVEPYSSSDEQFVYFDQAHTKTRTISGSEDTFYDPGINTGISIYCLTTTKARTTNVIKVYQCANGEINPSTGARVFYDKNTIENDTNRSMVWVCNLYVIKTKAGFKAKFVDTDVYSDEGYTDLMSTMFSPQSWKCNKVNYLFIDSTAPWIIDLQRSDKNIFDTYYSYSGSAPVKTPQFVEPGDSGGNTYRIFGESGVTAMKLTGVTTYDPDVTNLKFAPEGIALAAYGSGQAGVMQIEYYNESAAETGTIEIDTTNAKLNFAIYPTYNVGGSDDDWDPTWGVVSKQEDIVSWGIESSRFNTNDRFTTNEARSCYFFGDIYVNEVKTYARKVLLRMVFVDCTNSSYKTVDYIYRIPANTSGINPNAISFSSGSGNLFAKIPDNPSSISNSTYCGWQTKIKLYWGMDSETNFNINNLTLHEVFTKRIYDLLLENTDYQIGDPQYGTVAPGTKTEQEKWQAYINSGE